MSARFRLLIHLQATLIAMNVNSAPFTYDAQYDEPSPVGCNHSITAEQYVLSHA